MSEFVRRNILFSLLIFGAVIIIISLQFSKMYANTLGDKKLNEGKMYVDNKVDAVIMMVNEQTNNMLYKDSIATIIICNKLDSLNIGLKHINRKIK